MDLKIPILSESYVSVLRADAKNARYLNNDNSYFDGYQSPPEKGGKIYYYIYRSYEEAKNDILSILEKDSSFIFIIFDHEGNELEFFRPDIKHIPTPEKEGDFLNRLWKRIRNR